MFSDATDNETLTLGFRLRIAMTDCLAEAQAP